MALLSLMHEKFISCPSSVHLEKGIRLCGPPLLSPTPPLPDQQEAAILPKERRQLKVFGSLNLYLLKNQVILGV